MLEVALLLGLGHEEERRKLRVVRLECLSFLMGEQLDVIRHAELFALLLRFLLVLVVQLRQVLNLHFLGFFLFLCWFRLLLFLLAGEIRSVAGLLGLVKIEYALVPQSIAVGFYLRGQVLIMEILRACSICCYLYYGSKWSRLIDGNGGK